MTMRVCVTMLNPLFGEKKEEQIMYDLSSEERAL
jgi:hypothetical protein